LHTIICEKNDQWLLCLYVVILECDYMFNNHKLNISNFENQCTIFSVIVKTKSYLFYIRNMELKCFIFFCRAYRINSFTSFWISIGCCQYPFVYISPRVLFQNSFHFQFSLCKKAHWIMCCSDFYFSSFYFRFSPFNRLNQHHHGNYF
jgi:hypothetical protein